MTNLNSNYLDSSVRWTDKVALCHNGDIIETFTGKVVGHIDQWAGDEIDIGRLSAFRREYKEEENERI